MRPGWAVVLILIPLLAPATRSWAREVVQLTDDDSDDENPRIDGPNVVWQRDGDIFLFDGVMTIPLTDDLQDDENPAVSGSRVVWQTSDGFDWEIELWDGATGTVTPLTDDPNIPPGTCCPANDQVPDIDGADVVWTRDLTNPDIAGDVHVAHDDGMMTTLLGSFVTGGPAISGPNIAWVENYNFPYEVFLNGRKISDSVFSWASPAISGSTVVWTGSHAGPGSNREIFRYDGGSPIPMTDNDVDDENPKISGAHVVWQEWDGHDWEIEYFDGRTIQPLTDDDSDDENPDVSGSTVVWQGFDGHDFEIYMTTVPEAPMGALGACAAATLAALQRRRRRRSAVGARP
jgi:beta propeller repeat protein